MDILHALVLGIVQGLGEFLPISSSAHLILVPWLFTWPDQGLGFDVALHMGTVLAVIAYFRRDFWHLIRGWWHSLFPSTRDFQENIYQRLSWFIIVATIPAAIVGKLLESEVEGGFRAPMLIAGTLAVMGIVMWVADRLGPQRLDLAKIGWFQAIIIGIGQALAIVPGVSRSGATLSMGRFLGMKRADAARFSFLLSIPITLGAGIIKVPYVFGEVNIWALLVGFLASAITGWLAIRFLLNLLQSRGLGLFVWYRLIAAGIIIVLIMTNIR
jgi:undecaprenyl-diphosphatase